MNRRPLALLSLLVLMPLLAAGCATTSHSNGDGRSTATTTDSQESNQGSDAETTERRLHHYERIANPSYNEPPY